MLTEEIIEIGSALSDGIGFSLSTTAPAVEDEKNDGRTFHDFRRSVGPGAAAHQQPTGYPLGRDAAPDDALRIVTDTGA